MLVLAHIHTVQVHLVLHCVANNYKSGIRPKKAQGSERARPCTIQRRSADEPSPCFHASALGNSAFLGTLLDINTLCPSSEDLSAPTQLRSSINPPHLDLHWREGCYIERDKGTKCIQSWITHTFLPNLSPISSLRFLLRQLILMSHTMIKAMNPRYVTHLIQSHISSSDSDINSHCYVLALEKDANISLQYVGQI